jgi:hypothetical protein
MTGVMGSAVVAWTLVLVEKIYDGRRWGETG